MKFFVAFCLLAVAAAVDDVPVLKNVAEVGVDSYNYAYELGNGISANEAGSLTGPEGSIVAQGGYTWTSPEGETFSLQYLADADHGYQPTGAHIPQTPPLIQKSLDYLAEHPSVQKT